MCGIAGVLGGEVRPDALSAACDAMRHRGPDGEATWSEPGIGLAHTRLAIIDRAGGDQPMFTADDRYVVVFNGEIYNHRILRRELESRGIRFRTSCDTEVLLHLYALEGEAMVARLRGMFAFAVIDRHEGRALLARDRFGKKPLCYSESGGTLAFASTLDALRPLLASSPSVDLEAIAQYLVLQYVPAPWSAWTGIRKLEPGHLATWADGQLTVRRYWSPPMRAVPAASTPSPGEASERLRDLICEAVSVRLESEVPLGVFLSGGLDSSIVVAELARAGRAPSTYSVGFKRGGFDESGYARLVAKYFGTDHHELVADDDAPALFEELSRAYDEPFADSSALATLAVARAAREHATVILTGDGGDELFGGYRRYAAYRRARAIHQAIGPLAGVTSGAMATGSRLFGSDRLADWAVRVRKPWVDYRNGLFHFSPAELASILRPEVLDAVDDSAARDRLDALWQRAPDRLSTLLWVDEQTYLPDDLLVKVDRASMAHSLEARMPFLDHDLAAFVATLPEAHLFKRGTGKSILRDSYRDILPPETLSRGKMGFGVPVASWLRLELRPHVEDLLLSGQSPLAEWLNPEGVRTLVKRFLQGDDSCRRRTWNLLALAGWAKTRMSS
jgi:asparagine synthase (glutamine-hydrolysing)